MNCPTIDKLSDYIDEFIESPEKEQIENHIKRCEQCSLMVEAFVEEQGILKETFQTPTLPDDFAATVLHQLEPYEEKIVRIKQKPWKKVMLLAAGVVLAVGLTTTLNPSFAEWIGGLFSTEEVDEGLRIASDAGLAKRVNQEATDQNLTFKVEDVIADTTRVALSYQILNKQGKSQDTYLELDETRNKITAVDQNGIPIETLSMSWTGGSDYGLIEFSLREQDSIESMTVKFDLVELLGKEGKWELEIPVDLQESQKLTKNLSLKEAKTSTNGVHIDMKEVKFAPSSNELFYETSFTDKERLKLESEIQKLENDFGKENVHMFSNYGTAIQYHIENEAGEVIYYHNTFQQQGHPSDQGLLQGTGMPIDELGHVGWNESFIPQREEDKLTFVLDGVVKTVPSDFSIKIKPKELNKKPISFEYEGNYMTITKAKTKNEYSLQKSFFPIRKVPIYQVTMEGGKELPASDLGAWVLVDDKGKVYETFYSGSILDDKDKHGRYKTNLELKSYDMEEVPVEITLHLLSVTRYEEVKEKWEVPLYEVD